jgi:hypothetical protein
MGFAGVGSFEQGFSLYRSAHAVEFRKFYLKMLNVTHLTKTTRHRAPIIVNMYPKVVIGNGHVWSGVCKLANELSFVFSKLEFRCVSLHEMSLEVQAQVISQATIHVWPNGKPVAYSHECERFTNQSFGRWIGVRANLCGRRILGNLTRARLCQRNKCANVQMCLKNFIPWATVYYLHSLEESLSPVVFERASVFEWLHDAPAIRASKYYGAK